MNNEQALCQEIAIGYRWYGWIEHSYIQHPLVTTPQGIWYPLAHYQIVMQTLQILSDEFLRGFANTVKSG